MKNVRLVNSGVPPQSVLPSLCEHYFGHISAKIKAEKPSVALEGTIRAIVSRHKLLPNELYLFMVTRPGTMRQNRTLLCENAKTCSEINMATPTPLTLAGPFVSFQIANKRFSAIRTGGDQSLLTHFNASKNGSILTQNIAEP